MASTQRPPRRSIGSKLDTQGEHGVKVVNEDMTAAIEDPFVEQTPTASCQWTGEISTLEAMCKPATTAKHPRISTGPVTPRRISIPFNDPHVLGARMPPTPDQTPSRGIKRSFSATLAQGTASSTSNELFGIESQRSPSRNPFRRNSIPKCSILHKQQPCRSPIVSAAELKRVSEAVLKQVDWDLVEEEVASNRGAAVYRKVVKAILQERIDSLVYPEALE
ncbi:hypothetical protein MMC08_006638 [Hypocenomyce scalaris]|nr:hypothetical protein [Hypocenomyce scalaris]